MKNIKNYKYSTNILPNTSTSQAQSPVMAASSQEPAVQKSLSHDNNVPQQPTAYSASMSTSSVQTSQVDKLKKPAQKSLSQDSKDPVNHPQPTGTSPPGVRTRNVFSIFAQRTSGGGVHQEEPVAEVKPSDPLTASVGLSLQHTVNSAQNKTLSQCSMYVGGASDNAEWLSSVFSAGQNDRTLVQCSFCPRLGQCPRYVASHIQRRTPRPSLCAGQTEVGRGPPVYIKCRHCNYVTVDSTLAWIHFATHHDVSDILDCSDRAAHLDMSGPDMPEVFIDVDSVMGSKTAFVCFDCSAVNVDTDTDASSMLMVRHVARHHPNSDHCNGNIVKLLMLARNEADPNAIKGSPTYRQAMTDREHVRGRREIYMCLFCR